MKKLLCIAISAAMTMPYLISPATAALKANAETGYSYMRVITEDTPFFASPSDSSPLFYLPYTYYVKVIGKSGSFTRVEINGTGYTAALDGYVPTDMLFFDGLEVKNRNEFHYSEGKYRKQINDVARFKTQYLNTSKGYFSVSKSEITQTANTGKNLQFA